MSPDLKLILGTAMSCAGLYAVIVTLLKWARGGFSGKDRAETQKTAAESQSEIALSQERMANAEAKLSDSALSWAKRMSEELEKARGVQDETMQKLEETMDKLRETQRENDSLVLQLKELKSIMELDRQNCQKIQDELDKYLQRFRLDL
jgi:hypothetical protein